MKGPFLLWSEDFMTFYFSYLLWVKDLEFQVRSNFLVLNFGYFVKEVRSWVRFPDIGYCLKSRLRFFCQQYFVDNGFFSLKLLRLGNLHLRLLKLKRHFPILANREKLQNEQYSQKGIYVLSEQERSGLVRWSRKNAALPVGLFKHCRNLLFTHPWKIFHKFFNANTGFKMLKQSRNRHSSALETQSSAQMQNILHGIKFVRFQLVPIHTSNILRDFNNSNFSKARAKISFLPKKFEFRDIDLFLCDLVHLRFCRQILRVFSFYLSQASRWQFSFCSDFVDNKYFDRQLLKLRNLLSQPRQLKFRFSEIANLILCLKRFCDLLKIDAILSGHCYQKEFSHGRVMRITHLIQNGINFFCFGIVFVNKFLNTHSIFQIIEKGFYRESTVGENKLATQFFGINFGVDSIRFQLFQFLSPVHTSNISRNPLNSNHYKLIMKG